MKIHREGKNTLFILTLLLAITAGLCLSYLSMSLAMLLIVAFTIIFLLGINFFRNPDRSLPLSSNEFVYCPADGKVVAIEEVAEPEFFKDKRLQISIFMSPLNVHVNRNSISGEVIYNKHHNGKFLAAWNPKSSTENERCTSVIQGKNATILLRQVAGALARRIVNYHEVGQLVTQGGEMGFIKLGSRVDVYLPLKATVKVALDQVVKGNVDILAELKVENRV